MSNLHEVVLFPDIKTNDDVHFDGDGDDNIQKTFNAIAFLYHHAFTYFKEHNKTTGQGLTLPPPSGQCPFKSVFCLADVAP